MVTGHVEHRDRPAGHAPEGRAENRAHIHTGLVEVAVLLLAASRICGVAGHHREPGAALRELLQHIRLVGVDTASVGLSPVAEDGEGVGGGGAGGHLRGELRRRVRTEQIRRARLDPITILGIGGNRNDGLPLVLQRRIDRNSCPRCGHRIRGTRPQGSPLDISRRRGPVGCPIDGDRILDGIGEIGVSGQCGQRRGSRGATDYRQQGAGERQHRTDADQHADRNPLRHCVTQGVQPTSYGYADAQHWTPPGMHKFPGGVCAISGTSIQH